MRKWAWICFSVAILSALLIIPILSDYFEQQSEGRKQVEQLEKLSSAIPGYRNPQAEAIVANARKALDDFSPSDVDDRFPFLLGVLFTTALAGVVFLSRSGAGGGDSSALEEGTGTSAERQEESGTS